ncbi:hypothetical protein LZ575_20010 [Antarcticibacterium sp. 1MA-6-2]|uniref:hypothetical protein n=1 Tax=Antarcticibacterium sp. 1MA-6-2 TaxID=2908210 RepID=UPI001F165FB8|nr:hypothetical protein [Antarcticibacterium sp. 1MA-6-2]UJH90946.1 hypothetical protein LZ575_20010 [Antarcticibacterium sp. 1MA-6-2]
MLQKLYRHSDLKTTLNYQANFIHRDADDALDSVINFSITLTKLNENNLLSCLKLKIAVKE